MSYASNGKCFLREDVSRPDGNHVEKAKHHESTESEKNMENRIPFLISYACLRTFTLVLMQRRSTWMVHAGVGSTDVPWDCGVVFCRGSGWELLRPMMRSITMQNRADGARIYTSLRTLKVRFPVHHITATGIMVFMCAKKAFAKGKGKRVSWFRNLKCLETGLWSLL